VRKARQDYRVFNFTIAAKLSNITTQTKESPQATQQLYAVTKVQDMNNTIVVAEWHTVTDVATGFLSGAD
jgi:hypothetical protein